MSRVELPHKLQKILNVFVFDQNSLDEGGRRTMRLGAGERRFLAPANEREEANHRNRLETLSHTFDPAAINSEKTA